jgi:hypothetical protein
VDRVISRYPFTQESLGPSLFFGFYTPPVMGSPFWILESLRLQSTHIFSPSDDEIKIFSEPVLWKREQKSGPLPIKLEMTLSFGVLCLVNEFTMERIRFSSKMTFFDVHIRWKL